MHISVVTNNIPVSRLVGKGNQCIGVDVTASAIAPVYEITGNHLCLYGPDSLVLDALECLIRGGFPLAVGSMPLPIGENSAK